MPISTRIPGFSHGSMGKDESEVPAGQDPIGAAETNEKSMGATGDMHSSSEESLSKDVQGGVHKAEAIASVWTKNELYCAYAGIFIVFFVNSLQQQTTGNLTAYAISDFASHSLVSTISIVSSIVGGVLKLPIAKMLDLWGRVEGYCVMLAFTMIGLIMMAACNGVTTYAAAQVFYWVGFNGMGYVLDVFMADTSSLKNRALVFAFSTAPYIGTTFAGPAAAMDFYNGPGWRWGHGVWVLIMPFVSIPFLAIVIRNQSRAAARGLTNPRAASGRTLSQSLVHYFWEFDLPGVLLICAGFVLILLPLSLANSAREQWRSGSIIAMFVIGGLCLIAFALYERFVARKTFIPYDLLLDRTVLGACLLAMTLFVSFYCWDSYYSSYVQVVHNQNIKNAGYIYNIYSIGSCFWSLVVAAIIRATKKFKYLALAFGVPLYILGTGLMIHFRQAHTDIGYVVMCQIFVAFAGGTLVICEELAVMSASPHQNVAAVLAFIGLFSSIGGGIGAAISGAIWTNTLPGELLAKLPEAAKADYLTIYSSLPAQLAYPWGSPEREAIIAAYSVTQRYMVIAGTCVMVLSFVWVAIWRDIRVSDIRNTKGLVL
ncbi:siderophore iron transporter-like protein [Geopyxis carbonaria]|nr:siderophore iron transporter-like protein [Geopyxis carbonaria]